MSAAAGERSCAVRIEKRSAMLERTRLEGCGASYGADVLRCYAPLPCLGLVDLLSVLFFIRFSALFH